MAGDAYKRFFEDIGQVDLFARGLYWLAACDGVDDSEVEVIKEFLAEMECSELIESLGKDKAVFSVPAAVESFNSHLRQLFLKTSIVLIRADGVISDEERACMAEVANAFGMGHRLHAIESELDGISI
jgi:tellurite resistance protein